MYTIYRLTFADGRHYIGMTHDLVRRVKEHESGKTKSTKNRKIIDIKEIETCETRQMARKQEKYWKSGIGREILNNTGQ